MSELIAGNSIIRPTTDNGVLDAIHTDSILNAVNANGTNGVQTTENIGLAADATAQRIGLAAEASAQRVGLAADATAQRIGIEASATAQRLAVAELDAIGKVQDEVCDSSRSIVNDIHRTDNHLSGVIERNSLYNAGVTERSSDKTQDEVEKFGLRELEAIHGAEKYLYAGMSQNAKDILLFNASEFERVKLQAAADTAMIKQQQYDDTKQLLLQNCGDTASIKAEMGAHFKDLLLQAAENAKDAALTACINSKDAVILADRHAAEIARQVAECCCENKALILETSHKTEDLVRKLDEQRVRDELAKTREELIALRVRSTLVPAPVASVSL